MWNRLGKGGTKCWGKRGAATILTDGKVILLLKRGEKGNYFGYWGLPGGKVEEGETFLGGAQRETKEETGHMPICTRLASFDNDDGRFLFKSFLFKIDKPYEVKLSDEHTDYKWVPLKEVNDLKLHPKLQEIMPSILRTINQKFNNEKIEETVFYKEGIMKIGPFAIWEMQKYIDENSKPISEGLWDLINNKIKPNQTNANSLPPPPLTSLKPGTVDPHVIAYMPYVISELELKKPLPKIVEKALISILSRVTPEPYGSGGVLRIDWFKTIINYAYQSYIEECKASNTTPDPMDHRLLMLRNPIQLLRSIRSAMPGERFHGKISFEGGNSEVHGSEFTTRSANFQHEIEQKFFSKPAQSNNSSPQNNNSPAGTNAPSGANNTSPSNSGNNNSPSNGNNTGGSRTRGIAGIPPDMMKVILSLPKSAWYDNNGNMLNSRELNKKINDILMIGGFTGYTADAKTIPDLQRYIASIP